MTSLSGSVNPKAGTTQGGSLPEERLKTLFLEASSYLVDHPELLLDLPERFGLYVLPLGQPRRGYLAEPEALRASLRAAQAHEPEEGPVVWALMREGRVEAFLAPEGPWVPNGA